MTLEDRLRLPEWKVHYRNKGGRKIVLDSSLSTNQFIYHYLPWTYASNIFRERTLRFGLVNSWQDPYEKAWCDILFNQANSLSGVNAYGLCWTTRMFDEPFWRMVGFKRCSVIVRIRCRIRDILNAGKNLVINKEGAIYLGKVSYFREKELHRHVDDILHNHPKDVSSAASKLLLKKRSAFRFEKEVRLLWLDKQMQCDAIMMPIDPIDVISQVMISPHASRDEIGHIKNELKGYGIKTVSSGLFNSPRNSFSQ